MNLTAEANIHGTMEHSYKDTLKIETLKDIARKHLQMEI